MISEDDSMYTYEFKDHFIINSSNIKEKYIKGKKSIWVFSTQVIRIQIGWIQIN